MKNCKEFKGDRPCKYYWSDKSHNCWDSESSNYNEYSHRILLIKLDALGDVIRCTPLAEGIKKKYPNSQLIWLTQKESSIFLEGNKFIDKIISYNDENVRILQCQTFDIIINLDKDAKATSMMTMFNSEDKRGYGLSAEGYPIPLNKETEYHYKICLDNWGSKLENTKTYIEIFDKNKSKDFKDMFFRRYGIKSDENIVVLNTGCGHVYPHKKWTYSGYKDLIGKLIKDGNIRIILTGSIGEKDRNKKLYDTFKSSRIIDSTDSYSLMQFCYLIDFSDLVVTGDTMALHLGISLNKKIITFFGPTPHQETDLFGLGKKFVREELDCIGCHDQFECPYNGKCMTLINPDKVYMELKKII
jgi:heptosyltransferase-2